MLILEGGNAAWIDRQTGEEGGRAEQIDLRKFERTLVTSSMKEALKNLSGLYNKKFGEPLWEDLSIIDSGKVFSGSSHAMFDDTISDEEFVQHKPLVGDIDITIDMEKNDNLWEILLDLEGKELFSGEGVKVIYLGNNKGEKPGARQINSVFDLITEDGSVKVQVDFEPVDYEDGHPTEWAKFSHSASWDDIQKGIKGVAHKYAITNLARAISTKDNILIALPSSVPKFQQTGNPEDLKFAQTKGELKRKATNLSFAVASGKGGGMRSKLEPVLDESGDQVEVDGSKVYVEIKAKDASYEKSIAEMFKLLFGKEPTEEEVKKMHSFVGILELIGQNASKEEQEKFVELLIDSEGQSLFHHEETRTGRTVRSQELYRDGPEMDRSTKETIMNKTFEKLPQTSHMKSWADEKMEEYYKHYGVDKGSSAVSEENSNLFENKRYTFSQFWSLNNG